MKPNLIQKLNIYSKIQINMTKFLVSVTLVLVSTHSVLSEIKPLVGCENDSWYPFKDEKCIKFVDEFVNHEEAQTICTEQFQQSNLVHINSQEEQEFVTKLIFQTYQAVDDVWLGAIRSQASLDFIWGDDQSILEYTHWAQDSPSDDPEKNCTQLTSHLSIRQTKGGILVEDGEWVDVSCSKRNLVVCEKSQNWTVVELEKEIFELRRNLSKLRTDHETLKGAHESLQTSHQNLYLMHEQLQSDFERLPEMLWPRSCEDIRWREGPKNTIYPFGRQGKSVVVQCDFDTDGGDWTVIQRRRAGPLEEFYLDWTAYENGFGSVDQGYWIGLKAMNALTAAGPQELRVDLEDWEGNKAFAKYSTFSVGATWDDYRLSVEGYSGDAGDGLQSHNHMRFSTKDKDNDEYPANCAEVFKAAWWYHKCFTSSLNGLYHPSSEATNRDGIMWFAWLGQYYSLKNVEMKIRNVGRNSS